MLTELPFVTPDEVAEQFRPGGTSKTKSALETLRKRGLLSEGITRPLRDKQGRTRGTLRMYSTFVRDAAALAATSNDRQAKAFVTIAKRMEQRKDASKIADALAAAGSSLSSEQRTIFWMCKVAASEPATAQQLARYAAAVSRERQHAPQTWQVVLGHIASVRDQQADVRLVDGSIMRVLNRRLPISPADRLGAPVAIRWSDLGRGVWMTAEEALEVPLASEPVYPFERPDDQGPTAIPTAVLSGPATVRRSKRTAIID
ncbi:MAG TPA: hypothetical protein VHT27_09010 [Solirubrobacteraceae bacterium]|nr:hypothetical protein [Solirubrobacteraceae bacterium]